VSSTFALVLDLSLSQIRKLVRAGIAKSPNVISAMSAIDRKYYCPLHPHKDAPQSIGFGATISAPHMHAYALEWLSNHLKPGARVLDVGCGSGYLSACLAHMVGNEGMVYGIDHISELVQCSKDNISRDRALTAKESVSRIVILERDGFAGLPEHGPYDVIHVGAAAPTMPHALIEQLKPGGRMVIPVGTSRQEILAVDKSTDGSDVRITPMLGVRYIPLTTPEAQLRSA